MGLTGETLTQILIPVAAVIGIGFALLQWFLVSKVRVSGASPVNNGYSDSLIGDEEESVDALEVVAKCADIQSAISVGELTFSRSISLSDNPPLFSYIYIVIHR